MLRKRYLVLNKYNEKVGSLEIGKLSFSSQIQRKHKDINNKAKLS